MNWRADRCVEVRLGVQEGGWGLLNDITVFGEVDKVQEAIQRLRDFEPSEGYYLAYSGGKDSDTILALAKMSGVKFDAHYQLTTVDPPEVVRHIKAHPEVQIHKPELTMWKLIVKKIMPPTRVVRYCCHVLKEQAGNNRVVLLGVRRAESFKRSKRELYEVTKKQTLLLPIIDWSTEDVWEFIHRYNISYCSLYDEGFKRLGCIGCPMTGTKGQLKDFERWPKYKDAYLKAFEKMLEERKNRGYINDKWTCADDVMKWWISASGREGISQCDDDQGVMFE